MSDEQCARCHGEGEIERLATPDEVDNGYELGIAPEQAWADCIGDLGGGPTDGELTDGAR